MRSRSVAGIVGCDDACDTQMEMSPLVPAVRSPLTVFMVWAGSADDAKVRRLVRKGARGIFESKSSEQILEQHGIANGSMAPSKRSPSACRWAADRHHQGGVRRRGASG
jgi:hypothetical protein